MLEVRLALAVFNALTFVSLTWSCSRYPGNRAFLSISSRAILTIGSIKSALMVLSLSLVTSNGNKAPMCNVCRAGVSLE